MTSTKEVPRIPRISISLFGEEGEGNFKFQLWVHNGRVRVTLTLKGVGIRKQ